MRMHTGRVRLDDLAAHGPAFVHRLVNQKSNAYRFRSLGPGVSARAVEHALTDGVLSQFVLVADESPVGLLQAILPDFKHGTAQLAVLLDERLHRAGWPLEGLVLFVNHTFTVYPLRKIYLEILSPNVELIGARGLERQFRPEGVLENHEWFMGEYVDAHFYSISRDDFYADQRLVRLLTEEAGP
jgi:RimJ/RimL family protein N-acetyltransferase